VDVANGIDRRPARNSRVSPGLPFGERSAHHPR
jgi:hypothetical protein